ncbi:MAG: hypothetical protein AAGC55_07635 [Myxococcota bacterium]
MVFVLCARERIRVDGIFPLPAFLLVLIFIGAAAMPISIYLFSVHPAWSWMYLIDPHRVSDLLVVVVVLMQCGIVVAGWYLGAYLLQNSKKHAIFYAIAGSGAVLVLAMLIFAGRLGSYGTYQEFGLGETEGLMEVKLGYILIALVLGLGAAAGFVALELIRNARRVRTR